MEEEETRVEIDENGNYVLYGEFTTFNGTSNGRFYVSDLYETMFQDMKNKVIIDQRDETVDALLEGRDVKEIISPWCKTSPISISSRGYLDNDNYTLKGFDIVSDPGFESSYMSMTFSVGNWTDINI